MSEQPMTPREAADFVADFYARFDDTAGHALSVLIETARATSPAPEGGDLADHAETVASAADELNICSVEAALRAHRCVSAAEETERRAGQLKAAEEDRDAAIARFDSLQDALANVDRIWRAPDGRLIFQSKDAPAGAAALVPEGSVELAPSVAAPPREDEGNDREGEAHPFDAEWPDHDEPAITPAAPPAEGDAQTRPDRTARSLSLAGDFPNDGRIKVFLRVGHLTERPIGTVDRDELRWDVGPTMAAFLREAADEYEYENGAPLEPGETS